MYLIINAGVVAIFILSLLFQQTFHLSSSEKYILSNFSTSLTLSGVAFTLEDVVAGLEEMGSMAIVSLLFCALGLCQPEMILGFFKVCLYLC